jgi:peptidyl-prolyl cis-trans isomerase C
MTLKPTHLLVVLLAAVTAPSFAAPAKAEANVAVVGGKVIPASRLETIVAAQKAQGQADTKELRDAIKERLIALEILAQEATKSGVEKKDDVKLALDTGRQQILINALMRDYLSRNPLSAADIQAAYNAEKASRGDTEYRAFHILVEKEDEAKAIIAKLKAGAKFDELAKQSKDPGSAAKGGDLDWAPAGQYVPAFAGALAALKKGQFTEAPVKTEFGYHVIKLEDTRPVTFPTLEELKPQIVKFLEGQKAQAYQDKLIEAGKKTVK